MNIKSKYDQKLVSVWGAIVKDTDADQLACTGCCAEHNQEVCDYICANRVCERVIWRFEDE